MRGVHVSSPSPKPSAIAGAGRRFNPAGWPSTVGAEDSLGRIGSPPLELSGGSGFHRFFFILIEPCGGLVKYGFIELFLYSIEISI